MALVIFLRGINVGGHRTFRPRVLARRLSGYDVVNVGTAGTSVVRKPGSTEKFRAELLHLLPFEAEVVFCDGRELLPSAKDTPSGTEPARAAVIPTEITLPKPVRHIPSTPTTLT